METKRVNFNSIPGLSIEIPAHFKSIYDGDGVVKYFPMKKFNTLIAKNYRRKNAEYAFVELKDCIQKENLSFARSMREHCEESDLYIEQNILSQEEDKYSFNFQCFIAKSQGKEHIKKSGYFFVSLRDSFNLKIFMQNLTQDRFHSYVYSKDGKEFVKIDTSNGEVIDSYTFPTHFLDTNILSAMREVTAYLYTIDRTYVKMASFIDLFMLYKQNWDYNGKFIGKKNSLKDEQLGEIEPLKYKEKIPRIVIPQEANAKWENREKELLKINSTLMWA